MTILSQFADSITRLIHIIEETQQEPIARAAQLIAQAIADKRRVHVLGTGAHSMMAAEEVLGRAGSPRGILFLIRAPILCMAPNAASVLNACRAMELLC